MNAHPFVRSRPESCLSDRLLDRLRLGEMSELEREAAQSHLAGCSLCQRQRAELALAPSLLPNLAQTTGDAAHGRRTFRVGRPMVGLLLAAAMGLVLVVRARPREAIDGAQASASLAAQGTRLKGAPFSFGVIVRRATSGRVEPLAEGATLSVGDALRFRVYAPQGGYLAVVDLDGAGTVSSFVPAGGGALPLAQGGSKVLDGSVVLDVSGDERLIAVLCSTAAEAARSTEVARAALQGAHRAVADVTRLDLNCLQQQIRFRTQPPP
jgi:hypothetical protein